VVDLACVSRTRTKRSVRETQAVCCLIPITAHYSQLTNFSGPDRIRTGIFRRDRAARSPLRYGTVSIADCRLSIAD
jgi:hypothetical protein